jgi:hypothetical protein
MPNTEHERSQGGNGKDIRWVWHLNIADNVIDLFHHDMEDQPSSNNPRQCHIQSMIVMHY